MSTIRRAAIELGIIAVIVRHSARMIAATLRAHWKYFWFD
jgi:hypothetical protein